MFQTISLMKIIKSHILLFIALTIIFLFLIITHDNKKNSYNIPKNINKIVSLSPSITRQIVDLGAESLLVGVTRYHPPLKSKVSIIGSLIHPNIEKIVMLKPHIIFSSEHDNKIQFNERIKESDLALYSFKRVNNFYSLCKNFMQLGKMLNKEKKSKELIETYKLKLNQKLKLNRKYVIAMFISESPIMGISNTSFIGNAINKTGAINAFKDITFPYPLLSLEHIVLLNPDVVVSVTYNIKRKESDLKKVLKKVTKLKVNIRDSFYTIPANDISYYTPSVYVKIVGYLKNILSKEEKK